MLLVNISLFQTFLILYLYIEVIIDFKIAISSFRHDNQQTLSFKIGDKLELKEECEGYF